MKRKVTLITFAISLMLLLGLLMPQDMMAQKEDQTQILKKIIELPDLQKYYPVSSDGKVKQVTIQQHPVSFPSDLSLSSANTRVVFEQMAQSSASNTSAFFKFRSIETSQNTSKVFCHYFYNYDYTTNKSKIVEVRAELQKSGSDWKIVTVNVKGVQ
jgi:hypothetical protein